MSNYSEGKEEHHGERFRPYRTMLLFLTGLYAVFSVEMCASAYIYQIKDTGNGSPLQLLDTVRKNINKTRNEMFGNKTVGNLEASLLHYDLLRAEL